MSVSRKLHKETSQNYDSVHNFRKDLQIEMGKLSDRRFKRN